MSKRNDFSTLDLISAYEGKNKSTETFKPKDIEPSPNQPRQFGKNNVDDLVDSMKMGLIEPIVVRKIILNIVAGEKISCSQKDLDLEGNTCNHYRNKSGTML